MVAGWRLGRQQVGWKGVGVRRRRPVLTGGDVGVWRGSSRARSRCGGKKRHFRFPPP